MDIHVVIPHYRAEHWLRPCLELLHRRAVNGDQIVYTVLTMEDFAHEREIVRRLVGDLANVMDCPMPGAIGGQPLPAVLEQGARLRLDLPITVTVDPDALILADGWDRRVRELLTTHVAAGINPRSGCSEFAGVPEWNWCAFDTRFWRDHIGTFMWNRHDIGHLFADAAAKQGRTLHIWPHHSSPFEGKAAAVVGDSRDEKWAMHAFYSSRKRKDRIPEGERKGILSLDQEAEIVQWCLDF